MIRHLTLRVCYGTALLPGTFRLGAHFRMLVVQGAKAMTNALKSGVRPVAIRPDIPKADYMDEVSDEAFEKLRNAVQDLNDPKRPKKIIGSIGWPFDD
jgi:hypothetical protein